MQALLVSSLEEIATHCSFTEKQAEAFIAFYSQDKNKREIAKQLNISSVFLYYRVVTIYDKINYGNNIN